MPLDLSPERDLLFRITHVSNLPWLLKNGLSCASARILDPNFVEIGNPDLIRKRRDHSVPKLPCGTLADYVPFYLTPKSPMLLNIKTGWKGVTRRPNSEIVIIVSSLSALRSNSVTTLITDRHAYMATARWSADPSDLATMIDWDILRRHEFKGTDDYPDKMDRYQAEALAHAHVPVVALKCIGCVSTAERAKIEVTVKAAGLALPVFARPGWYF